MGIAAINDDNKVPVYQLPPHERPSIGFNSDPTLQARKAGVLPFVKHNGEIYVLLQCKACNGLFESFSGSVDYDDTLLEETAAREASEESNGVLEYTAVRKEISQDFCLYHQRGKFCLFFLEISGIHPSVFGDRETHDNIPRTCHWVKLTTARAYNLHPGLKYSTWDTTLEQLLEN